MSTGTKAVFLSPTDALHGDIGIVGEADLLVAFSKSGGSEELLKLLPFAKVPATGACGNRAYTSSRAHVPSPALQRATVAPEAAALRQGARNAGDGITEHCSSRTLSLGPAL